MVDQGRFFSSAFMLCVAIIMMVALIVPPAAAAKVYVVQNKDEAVARCQNIQPDPVTGMYGQFAVYRDTDGYDIFYSCGYQSEDKSDFDRSMPCNLLQNRGLRVKSPEHNVRYYCSLFGGWKLEQCIGRFVNCRTVEGYQG
ncbi:predicted protein [Lichtheimia corymbifera JMRC:FSU:9682]|uniref:Secreted protein n=1 Tax=Lichtheimia corymbifera JMRC:FSU:9682 TaxID=1263082 RepID=A0A068RXB9_9FUNG|nr:predicted protein [Lichtheimia corymbifera JMRC:FSU:9682]